MKNTRLIGILVVIFVILSSVSCRIKSFEHYTIDDCIKVADHCLNGKNVQNTPIYLDGIFISLIYQENRVIVSDKLRSEVIDKVTLDGIIRNCLFVKKDGMYIIFVLHQNNNQFFISHLGLIVDEKSNLVLENFGENLVEITTQNLSNDKKYLYRNTFELASPRYGELSSVNDESYLFLLVKLDGKQYLCSFDHNIKLLDTLNLASSSIPLINEDAEYSGETVKLHWYDSSIKTVELPRNGDVDKSYVFDEISYQFGLGLYDPGGYFIYDGKGLLKINIDGDETFVTTINNTSGTIDGSENQSIFFDKKRIFKVLENGTTKTLYKGSVRYLSYKSLSESERYGTSHFFDEKKNSIIVISNDMRYVWGDIIDGDLTFRSIIKLDSSIAIFDVIVDFPGSLLIFTSDGVYRFRE